METNTSLYYGFIAFVLIGILFVFLKGGVMKKGSKKLSDADKQIQIDNSEIILKEMISEQNLYHYYSGETKARLRSFADVIAIEFQGGSNVFKYWLNEGAIQSNNPFDFYYTVWSEQLRGRIPLDDAKHFINEALFFLDYLIKAEVDLEKANNKMLMNEGKYSELKHNVVRLYTISKDSIVKMVDPKSSLFFQEYAIWKRGMEATGLFILEPSVDKMLVGINRIPREYFDFNTFEYFRSFLEQSVVDFFINRNYPFSHMAVTQYQTSRIDRRIVIPRWHAEFGKPKNNTIQNTQLER